MLVCHFKLKKYCIIIHIYNIITLHTVIILSFPQSLRLIHATTVWVWLFMQLQICTDIYSCTLFSYNDLLINNAIYQWIYNFPIRNLTGKLRGKFLFVFDQQNIGCAKYYITIYLVLYIIIVFQLSFVVAWFSAFVL